MSMMKGGIGEILGPLIADPRAGPVHLCLYLAVWQCGEREGRDGCFLIRRSELMFFAKIRGKTTYFRVMRELAEWGSVEYRPSMDKGGRSRVRVAG